MKRFLYILLLTVIIMSLFTIKYFLENFGKTNSTTNIMLVKCEFSEGMIV
ncbi:MAG: hypothetical protein GX196_07695 [Clostridiaceae bacterium]|nr:hypothetical protein [Clostridiaceae bacterium]